MNELDILEQQAVDAAINLNWAEAIALNKQIVEKDPQNISAYLRLGFANLQVQDYATAKTYYNTVLKIQPINQVAIDNLEKLSFLEEKGTSKTTQSVNLNPNLFLEIPGKTKTVTIVNLGQKNLLALLAVGQKLELKAKTRKIEVRTMDDEYVGALPDDLSKRLLFFLSANSTYSTYVKEASMSRVVIFIKEEKKGSKVSHYFSFPPNISSNINNLHAAVEEDEARPEAEEEGNIEDDELQKLAKEYEEEEDEEKLIDIQSEEEVEEEE
ncbi:tetratricopeptide repeat protein [Candidatus Roizmanbacteria bacterium]|nr:tetratricopeptide repeat protein [Candidatus Roizmanbacteria bacterium]